MVPQRLWEGNVFVSIVVFVYLSVLSSIIITMNPIIRPKVACFSNPFLWLSGMISSLITKSMAPAA